jgi:hypothetical protein
MESIINYLIVITILQIFFIIICGLFLVVFSHLTVLLKNQFLYIDNLINTFDKFVNDTYKIVKGENKNGND